MKKPSRRRPSHERLRADDFDDVQYSVEAVRLSHSKHATIGTASDRTELVESAFVVVVGVAMVAGAVAAGVVALETTTAMASAALWYLLPMVLLPVMWFAVLHAWETRVLAPTHADEHTAPPPKRSSISHRGASKVAIF